MSSDHPLITDSELLQWSDSDDGEAFPDSDEELREEDFEDNRVEDEDWDVTERDFTKQYNRLRQHVSVLSGTVEGTPQTTGKAHVLVAPLPAVNRPPITNYGIANNETSARGGSSTTTVSSAGAGAAARRQAHMSNQLEALAKYAARLKHIDAPYHPGSGLGASVNRKGPSAHANMRDKADRATHEQVLDPRTRVILYKMLGRGLLKEINGCVSTGKEANVYHALTPNGRHVALKIYKTSILVFKDRDRYVTGERRFQRGYARHNPRKMVRMWAEKEMRNLKRLYAANIPCPEPIEVRENVLVMGFLGDSEGWASPRLKDADIPPDMHTKIYIDLLMLVRRLYHSCRLVHADFSEYNILYHEGQLCVIDVSQSVEHDHPHAFDFLRADLTNVERHFEHSGIPRLGLRRAFEFVIREREELIQVLKCRSSVADAGAGAGAGANADANANAGCIEDNLDPELAVLEFWLRQKVADGEVPQGEADDAHLGANNGVDGAHEDAVFMRSYIPRTLNQVYDPERDVEMLTSGTGEALIYANTIGLVGPSIKPPHSIDEMVERMDEVGPEQVFSENLGKGGERNRPQSAKEGDNASDDESSGDSEDEDEEVTDSAERKRSHALSVHMPRGHRHEDRSAKKERKKAVKEENRERRKKKMPKAEKKKKIKKSSNC